MAPERDDIPLPAPRFPRFLVVCFAAGIAWMWGVLAAWWFFA